MEMERSHMTERMLDLTLEIIYLLTGENYIAFKLSNGLVAPNLRNTKSPFTQPPPPFLTSETSNDKKIQEVTNKIIELLTGEVPIRCQDVTVSFSMEEWEYLEGHKDLYKDVMIEDRPPLTLPDGSSNQNTSERCPRPLYSWDPTQEHQEIPQEDQVDGSSKRNPPDRCSRPLYSQDSTQEHQEIPQEDQVDGSSNRHPPERCSYPLYSQDPTQEHQEILQDNQVDGSSNRNPPERCPRPLYSRDPTQKHQENEVDGSSNKNNPEKCPSSPYSRDCNLKIPYEDQVARLINVKVEVTEREEEMYLRTNVQCKKEKGPTEAFNNRNTPERCPHPLYAWDSTQEHHRILQYYPDGNMMKGDVKMEVEDPYMRGDEPCMEKETPPETRTAKRNNPRRHPLPSPDDKIDDDDDLTSDSAGENPITPNLCSLPLSDPSMLGGCFSDDPHQVAHHTGHSSGETLPCPECGGCFSQQAGVNVNTGDTLYSCSECGKCFTPKTRFVEHIRTNTGTKPYACPQCGKAFPSNAHLVIHYRLHTGEKPYSCSECGKRFHQKSNLNHHQVIHSGEKPFSCLECGKRFLRKADLVTHQKTHSGLKPYSCPHCGKCYRSKSTVMKHQRIHMG